MDCDHGRIQELLDGALSAAETARVEGHMRTCASCALELRRLAAAARFVSRLPRRAPGAAFNARVMASLGLTARRPFPRWAAWTAGAGLSWVSCGLAAMILAARRRMDALDVLKGGELLAHPARAAALLKVGAAKGALLLMHAGTAAAEAGRALAETLPSMPGISQLIAASLLSGLMIAFVSNQQTPHGRFS